MWQRQYWGACILVAFVGFNVFPDVKESKKREERHIQYFGTSKACRNATSIQKPKPTGFPLAMFQLKLGEERSLRVFPALRISSLPLALSWFRYTKSPHRHSWKYWAPLWAKYVFLEVSSLPSKLSSWLLHVWPRSPGFLCMGGVVAPRNFTDCCVSISHKQWHCPFWNRTCCPFDVQLVWVHTECLMHLRSVRLNVVHVFWTWVVHDSYVPFMKCVAMHSVFVVQRLLTFDM